MQNLKAFILAAALLIGVQYATAAWNPPSQTPPNNNTDTPLNIGSTGQQKLGSLVVNANSSLLPGAVDPIGLTVFGNTNFQGGIKIVDGTQGVGKVLTSDANGLASWQTASGTSSGGGGQLHPGWPNVIKCSSGAEIQYLYLNGFSDNTYPPAVVAYVAFSDNATQHTHIFFNPTTGAYMGDGALTDQFANAMHACENKNISQIPGYSTGPGGDLSGGGTGSMHFITPQTLTPGATKTSDKYGIYDISAFVPPTATVAIVTITCASYYGTNYSVNERATSQSPSVNICHVGFSHSTDAVGVTEQFFIPISNGSFQLGGSPYGSPILMGYI